MQSEKSGVSSNVISLPEGGGAMKGMGETFSADLFSGTGNYSVPISVPKGRMGMEPQLSLGYSTGNGNGICGQGWNLSLPGVSRKTSLGIPQYRDDEDTFVLSGAEDLIPVSESVEQDGEIRIKSVGYKPRTEGLFARIIHVTANDGRNYWEVKTKDGKTSLYGNPDPLSENSCRLVDPKDSSHIFHWCIFKTTDLLGNEVVYKYLHLTVSEDNYPFSQIYLNEIVYADFDNDGTKEYLCSVKMNYEERPDVFSQYNSSFEIRTTLRLKNIETFTHPLDADLPSGYTPQAAGNDILVKRYNLTYRDQTALGPIGNGVSLLVNVEVEGHGPNSEVEKMPPVEFGYTEFDGSSRDLIALNQDHLPSLSLADPSMNMVDLDGNGLPDFVQIQPGLPIRYWKNRGRGEFDLPRQMKDAPVGLSLTDGSTQFMDADGDGRADLVLNSPRVKGYFPLRYDGQWDERRYTPYKTSPTVNFASADVQFMDLTGDGRTDVIINGDRSFICYFQNSPLVGKPGEAGENTIEPGWSEMRRITKGDLDDFPNVNFSDPRIRTADLSGDGLQDIVMLSNGAVFYWPNLGYGRFGKKRRMKNAPRLGFNFDPNRVILADINGDGLADYIYINYDSVDYWINQSGESWGDQLEIKGTPRFTSRNSITVTDLMGTGTPGILWTFNAGESRDRMYYVDLTKGQKPYLLNEVDNNLGALTRVHYTPSTEFYLRDLYGESPESFPYIKPVGAWKTTLPFPVLTVSKVEAIDRISKNKLVTRYFYHHGYWDGVEREFRGFGRVDQFDTETFEAYNEDSLVLDENFDSISPESYSPPVYTKNWFNLGPVQLPNGDWGELDTSDEFWAEDPSILQRPSEFNALLRTLTRRGRRDALRTLRGSAIRSELYAKDGSARRERPYSVKETQTSVKFIDGPKENPIIEELKIKLNSGCIFFPYQYSSRESMWERGEDPKTSFSFTGELDEYGQVLQSISIAVPRGKDPLTGGQLGSNPYYDPTEPYRAVLNSSEYVYKDETNGLYFVDRIKQSQSEEITGTALQDVFTIRENAFTGNATTNLLSHQLNYYDGAAFIGEELGTLGSYGLLVRSESLMVTPQELTAGYGSNIPPAFSGGIEPDWNGYPAEFVSLLPDPKLGYTYRAGTGSTPYKNGYYATGDKLKYDTQTVGQPNRGLVLAKRDVYNNETSIVYDDYHILPTQVTDPGGMTVSSLIDYRLLAPWQLTDPNENVTRTAFNALGLVTKIAVCGKIDSSGNTQGDTLAVPGTTFTYDFLAFINDGDPISVRKSVREHHIYAPYLSSLPTAEQNATIQSADYSDGYGRVVQSRAQAEDVIYGNQIFGDSGLPARQLDQNQNAVGIERSSGAPLNVVVSGHKRYNNKGEIVEQFEPYFNSGFDYDPDNIPEGVAIKMYYDALGRMIKTLNPDESEQLVVFGIPEALNTPSIYAATPWERYHYSPNDLAGITNPGVVPTSSHWTPKSELIDPLGNVIRTTEHQAHYNADTDSYEDVVMQYNFDIKGQLIESIDPFDRVISANKYSTAGQMLRTTHIDRGEQTLLVDALNLPFVTNDAKGAGSLFAYDNLQRPLFVWAKDNASEQFTKRQIMEYGDSAGFSTPEDQNLKGKLYKHNDEAGELVYENYDFKGNNLQFYRQIITDDALTAYQKYVVNWDAFNPVHLSSTKNTITQEYDALNRIRKATYPADRDGPGKEMYPEYNKGGALLSLKMDGAEYVKEVAYNARGQRILIAYGNKIMTRYAYDPNTFRVLRQRSALFIQSGHTYTPNKGIRQDLQYTYDLEGTITSINDAAPANTSAQGPGDLLRVFTHDPLRRLLSATGRETSNVYAQPSWNLNIRTQDYTATNTYTRSYQYDKIGNIQKLQHQANGHTNQDFNRDYTYDNSNNKLKSFTVNSTAYLNQYDPNGSLTKEGQSRYYEWGSNDKLAVFKNQAGTSTPSVYTNYFYNAQGERIKKHTRKGNKITVTFYMDGGMFETTYTKTVGGSIDNNRYFNTIKISDDGALIATIRVGNNVDDSTPAIKYIVGDHLNNSTAVLKATTGSLINREEFYPFGETSFGSYQFKRYRYNGKEKDEESGLYEYGQRYYAPWLCRFVSVDPIAENFPYYSSYNYAGNKPITKVDLEGLQENDAPQKIQPKGGTVQLPDAQPNIATFELKVFEVVANRTGSTAENTYTILGIGVETNKRDNIFKPDQLFQPMTDRERNQEFYNDIVRYGNGKLINTIMGMDYSEEFKSKLFNDWIGHSGNRFHDHPMGRLFTEFVLTFAAGGALEALAGGNNVLTSSRSYDELYSFEQTTAKSQVNSATNTHIQLFRAVSKEELDDIASHGIRNKEGYETGKLFATDAQDASNFGRINYAIDGKPFTIIETSISKEYSSLLYRGEMDAMQALSVPKELFQKVPTPTVLKSTPIPNHYLFK